MILVLIAVLVFTSVALVSASVLSRSGAPTMESRIQDFRARTATREADEVDLSIPFAERVLKPGVEGMAHAISSVLPASLIGQIENSLLMAGNPMRLNTYLTVWAVSFFSLAGIGVMMFVALPANLLLQKVMLLLTFCVMGWIFPRTWLKGQVRSRQKQIIKALPDALDLVTTCVEAGLGLDAALARVAEKSTGPFPDELSRMLRDVAMGKLRREALIEMAQRCGVDELTSFVNSVIQAEQLGVGIAQVLRVQSDQLRMKRRQRAERTAHEAPIKMLFPLVLFIFPAFLIVILGPAAIQIARALG